MFHLEKHRHQLIIEVKLPDAAIAEYKKEKEADPTGSAVFSLETEEDLTLAELVSDKKPFKASIVKKNAPEKCVYPYPSIAIPQSFSEVFRQYQLLHSGRR